ncbi:hypothetical protein MWU61_03355 [Loktanella sp. F6476L]|uniref:hypothetical protein n=1 Tax=Loktanella sp. F6476L TaxID=2926405 RepID=UPI001FF1DD2A|nr:hypothetical protein [Loktanella sp. F6476L]MCK0119563.1 hypothetical protein [Loktanella sp. F6476L]
MILELSHWGREFLRRDKALIAAYHRYQRSSNPVDVDEAIYELEHHLLWVAFFARRLFEEGRQAAERDTTFTPVRPPIEEIVQLSNSVLNLDGSIGANFKHNQTFSISVFDLCSQFIHNAMMNWEWATKKNEPGLFLSSDTHAKNKIYFVRISVLSKIAFDIANLSQNDEES